MAVRHLARWLLLTIISLTASCASLAQLNRLLGGQSGALSDGSLFVSPSGNDSASGTASEPLLTISTAVTLARSQGYTNILLQSGNYNPASGLDLMSAGLTLTGGPLRISGGWNSNFSSRNGRSVLSGETINSVIIAATNFQGLTLEGLTLKGAINNDNYGVGGGLLCIGGNGLNMRDCSVTSNYLTSTNLTMGGGIFLYGVTNASLSVAVSSNFAIEGGGIRLRFCSSVTLEGSVIDNRLSYTSSQGGGVMITESSGCLLTNLTVMGNRAWGFGGGVSIKDPTGPNRLYADIISNTTFSDVGAGLYGYGIRAGAGDEINCRLLFNNAENNGGGGACFQACSNLTVAGSFYGNTALNLNSGGGVFFVSSRDCLVTAEIVSNYATDFGGGISSAYSSLGIRVTSVIASNYAGNKGGGAICGQTDNLILDTCQFVANTSGQDGAALWLCGNRNSAVSNCIFLSNNSLSNSSVVLLSYYSNGTVILAGNHFYGMPGAGIAIRETLGESTNHIMTSNVFFTNMLSQLLVRTSTNITPGDISILNNAGAYQIAEAWGNTITSE